jgi:hypothetical protein
MKHKKKGDRRIGDKIRVLRNEGKSENAAVGEAEGMERSGRLKKGGKYIHKRKGRGHRRSTR